MTKADQEAWKLAIESKLAGRGVDRQQIESMLKDDPWEKVGRFAAYGCQTRNLDLDPWQVPPCWISDPDNPDAGLRDAQRDTDGRYEAAKLLREMLSLGISRWHPDPEKAIAEAKRRTAG